MSTKSNEAIATITNCELFDEAWYLATYPDVVASGVGAAEHYLRVGGSIGRHPHPGFDGGYYLQRNPDVAAAGLNPLLHYIEYGRREGRQSRPAQAPRASMHNNAVARVDVVVPVYNALEDVRHCLRSLEKHRDGFVVRILVVNDGSNEETTGWLREFCLTRPDFRLIEHAGNRGYTKAVNTGLRASSAPYVVTLNSDTIVVPGWVEGMLRCMASDPKLGVVGPLSNAASWQNVPKLLDENGTFAVNQLVEGMTAEDMAFVVARCSSRLYPRVPFVNGFCFMIRREVINAIGVMDEENFPVGYGEENDFCIRAADAGFELAIADDTYVFHAKSKSFGHERRKELSAKGSETLKRKHGSKKFEALVAQVRNTAILDEVRAAVQEDVGRRRSLETRIDPASLRVLFLLPVRGGGGGAHSVVQEVAEMRRLGLMAHVGVSRGHLENFIGLYPDIDGADQLFVAFDTDNLLDVAEEYDVVVATIFSSVKLVRQVAASIPHILPAYYVQDYEPMFFDEGTPGWTEAAESYTLIPGAVLFAKTDWIARTVREKHGVMVNRVKASIDHDVYRPRPRPADGRIRLAAMIRPQTPRRGAERTMKLLSRLWKKYGTFLSIELFGCDSSSPQFADLTQDFPFTNLGILKRQDVAALLARSDVFIDMSDYQAFGRTALEAMASGCTALVPASGGADEYAVDGENAIVVDTLDPDAGFDRLDALLSAPEKLEAMQLAGLETASRYSVHSAAVSEIALFAKALKRHREIRPVLSRTRVAMMPSFTRNVNGFQVPTGSGFVRIVQPYRNRRLQRDYRIVMLSPSQLPEPGSASVALLQRDVRELSLPELQQWLPMWRAKGGTFAYEVDDDIFHAHDLRLRGVGDIADEMAEKALWMVRNADVVSVSTEPLAELVRPMNPNVVVLPNVIDHELWRINRPRDLVLPEFARQTDGPVRIGYVGTPTHDADLEMIAGAVRRIEVDFGNRVQVEVVGAFQKSPVLFGTRVGLPKVNDYPHFVNWLLRRVHWDIGLVPLVDNAFNRSKSHLKFLECGALGMAMVCSDVYSFKGVAIDGENALVVPNDEATWYDAIRRLVESRELRDRLERRARDDVRDGHTLETRSAMHRDFLARLCSPREN